MNTEHDFHNPDNITPAQVGEGYRLMLKSEIIDRTPSGDIQCWYLGEWYTDEYCGNEKKLTYRVPLATWPLPKDISPVTTESEKTSLGRIAYDAFNKASCNSSRTWELASDKAKKYWESAALAIKNECLKGSSPTDNDAWNSLLATNAQLGKKVEELEGVRGDLKTVADVLQDFEGDTVHEQAQQAVQKIDELQSKLQKAEARLKQLEWVSFSEREPMQEDTDGSGYVVVANRNQEWQTPWPYHPKEATHWRRFVSPIIDNDEVDFENWYLKNGSSYVGVKKGNMRKIWKAAREVKL